MAIFLLINSVGYTVYAHYCNDELKDTSVIAKAESCCEEETPATENASEDEMSCCAEKDVHIVIKDHFVKSESSFSVLTQPVYILNSNVIIAFNFYELPTTNYQLRISEGDSSPPADLNLLNSVFRI